MIHWLIGSQLATVGLNLIVVASSIVLAEVSHVIVGLFFASYPASRAPCGTRYEHSL